MSPGYMRREHEVSAGVGPTDSQELRLLHARAGDIVLGEYLSVLYCGTLEGAQHEGPEGTVGVEVDERVNDAVEGTAELAPYYVHVRDI